MLHGTKTFRSEFAVTSTINSFADHLVSVLIQHGEDIPEPQETAAGQALYFEVLELQPIKLSLSFMRTERVSSEEKYAVALFVVGFQA